MLTKGLNHAVADRDGASVTNRILVMGWGRGPATQCPRARGIHKPHLFLCRDRCRFAALAKDEDIDKAFAAPTCRLSLSFELDKASTDPALRRLAKEPALFLGPIVIVTNP